MIGGIGLAMIRREVETGASLIARWSEADAAEGAIAERKVDVVALPFAVT
jgi:hypothetical protein